MTRRVIPQRDNYWLLWIYSLLPIWSIILGDRMLSTRCVPESIFSRLCPGASLTFSATQVEVSPVLIQKGTTQVALYGMGSMRDERLNRMWQGKKVRFLRPEEDDNDDDDDENNEGGFFNIFTLHQNRDLGRGSKNCVQENMIPDWMDLVVWGHEHECLIEFFESIVGTFRITQPGSSVATSLVAGEAVRKRVGVLDIKGKNFRLHPVPLTQVRGFATTEISLKEHKARLDPDDPKIDEKIGEILDQEVKLMVATARRKRQELIDEAKEAGNNAGGDDGPLKHKILKPNEVLVRIRVDHQGFTAISNQRFGARYVGEVANPTDILLFHRRKETRGPSLSAKQKAALAKTMVPEELERTNMEDLVSDQLNAPDRQLKLMDRQRLNTALEEYVDKKLTATIGDTVTSMLKETQKKFIKRVGSEGAGEKTKVRDELDKETQQKTEAEEKETKRKEKRKSQAHDKVEEEEEEDVVEEQQPPRRGDRSGKENSFDEESQESAQKPSSSKSQTARSAAGDAKRKADRRRQLLDDSDDDMEVEETVKPKAKARERRSASKRPVVYNLDDSGEDEEDAFVAQDDEDEDEDEELEVDEVVPAKKSRSKRTPAASKKRPAARARSTSTSGTARKSSSSRKKSTSRFDDSDDEDDAPYGGSIELNDDWGTAATRSQI